MRTAADVVQDSKAFAIDDGPKTWRLLAVTLVLQAGAFIALIEVRPWYLQLPLGALLGLLQLRLFAFYHDLIHGAVLRRSRLASVLAHAIGTYLMAVPSVWRETHDFHHVHNSKLLGSSIGSYPVASVAMWAAMAPRQRRAYRRARHPLTLLFGYLTIFMYGMNIAPFVRNPSKHWSGPIALVFHVAVVTLAWKFLGAHTAVFGVLFPLALSHTLGAYLFYAQHNFSGARFHSRDDWTYLSAALGTSSMFDMSPLMHWFTGNIGYHHVHHLNHRIPFYRLPEAMMAIEELQTPQRTSWSPRDIASCLRLALWDADRARMVALPDVPR